MLHRLSSQRCDRGSGASCSPSCAATPGNLPLYVRRSQDKGPTTAHSRRLVVTGATPEMVDALSQMASHLPLEQIAAPCQVMKCGDIVYRRQVVMMCHIVFLGRSLCATAIFCARD